MASNKETIKIKIGALSVVTAYLKFIKNNRKYQRFKHKKEEMLGKTVVGYHGLIRELLLHDKEFRMFLQMNTETNEVSKFVLISVCATRWGRGRGITDRKSGRKNCAPILTLKHSSREPTQNRNASEMHF